MEVRPEKYDPRLRLKLPQLDVGDVAVGTLVEQALVNDSVQFELALRLCAELVLLLSLLFGEEVSGRLSNFEARFLCDFSVQQCQLAGHLRDRFPVRAELLLDVARIQLGEEPRYRAAVLNLVRNLHRLV